MKDLIIPNQSKLEELKIRIQKEGINKLHILADFDRTLTKVFVDGRRISGITSILRNENYLNEEYSKKAQALFDKYHPFEINPNISSYEKKKYMKEWWMSHFKLMIKSKLNINNIKKVVDSGIITLREGILEFFNLLHKNNIPIIIFSSSGLGKESISRYLGKQGILYKNVYIISNEFEWDKDGYAIKIKEPIIHTLNKDEMVLKDFPFFKVIKNRKNVLLLGDSLDDTKMITGFDYNALIKIGFLNENIEENLEHYKKVYDVVILNDGDMNFINDLLKGIIS